MSSIPPATISVPDPDPISHLELIQQVVANITGQLLALDKEITRAINAVPGDAPESAAIATLSSHLKDIRAKAELSSIVINESLEDEGKAQAINSKLALSGETLKNMNKWMELIKELESELKGCEYDYYRIVADLLQDVKEQSNLFTLYRSLPYVSQILTKVSAIEAEISRQVQWTFREIGPLAPSDPELNPNGPSSKSGPAEQLDMQTLNQVYLVVDVLGYAFRRDLLERFAQLQLLQYEKAFKFGTKYCGLDSLDRRYVWFRHLLKVVEEQFSEAFPKSWCVSLHLFSEFARRTKKHLEDYLNEAYRSIDENDPGKYVGMALASLKSILKFEAEVKASFEVASRGRDEEEAHQFEEIKRNIHPIADAFDPFLGPYVTMERDELDRLMFKLNEEESRAQYDLNNNNNSSSEDMTSHLNKGPYDSSRQMFEFIKASLKRCTTFSTGITYLSLSREYRICLHNYAESLKFRCPSPVVAEAGKAPSYMISLPEEISLCRLICTGEYCMDTIPPLETKMKEHIHPMYRDEIDFTAQMDAFVDTISHTLSIMIAGINSKLEPIFKAMRKIDWSSVSSVGDDSQYVKEIRKVCNDSVPRIRSYISKIYFQNFCLKLVTAILDKLNENIWKLKRITMTGAGQLLLDLNGMKTYFLKMPQIGLQGQPTYDEYAPTKMYTTLVNQRISKIEIILKLVCAEDDKLAEMFQLLWPDGTSSDFDAVVDLKARTGIAAPLDKVSGLLNKGAGVVGLDVVGKGLKSTVTTVGGGVTTGLKEGGKSMFGGITHAAGDIKDFFTSGGSLFEDNKDGKSKHGNGTAPMKKQSSTMMSNGVPTSKR